MAADYAKLDHPDISKVLFHPRREPLTPPAPEVTDCYAAAAGGTRLHLRFYLKGQDCPSILFFHGNGETVTDYDDVGPRFNEYDLNFLAAEYRGYGASEGTPSASAMMADCHCQFDFVRAWLMDNAYCPPLFIMGRSLGSAPAIDLAATHPTKTAGLIIESGFGLTMPLLRFLGVDPAGHGITEADGFRNVHKIREITKPTFMLHAQFDQIIPVHDAEMLQVESAAHAKEFQVVPGADHNTIMAVAGRRYFDVLKRFVDKTLKVRGRRRP